MDKDVMDDVSAELKAVATGDYSPGVLAARLTRLAWRVLASGTDCLRDAEYALDMARAAERRRSGLCVPDRDWTDMQDACLSWEGLWQTLDEWEHEAGKGGTA